MTCHTCQQGVEVIVDHLYGRRSFRCGCGVISRREPPPLEVKPVAPLRDRVLGYTENGVYYGTCRVCRDEFESVYARKSCGKRECSKVVHTEQGMMMDATCKCGTSYQTRRAMPADKCVRCRHRTYAVQHYKAKKARLARTKTLARKAS